MLAAVYLLVAAASGPPTLAEPTFNVVNVSPELAKFAAEHLATQFTNRGIRVVTANEISALLGLEKQKQLLGCADTSTDCMAELANALGTDGILLGQIGKFGARYQVNLKVVRNQNAELLATWTRSVEGDDQLIAALTQAADQLVPLLLAKFRPGEAPPVAVASAPPAAAVETSRPRSVPWVPIVAAGGLALVSGACFALAVADKNTLEHRAAPMGPDEATSTVRRGTTFQDLSRVGAGLAAGSLIAAGILYAFGGSDGAQAALSVDGHGAMVGIRGALP